jgi:hypothetical protein
MRIEARHRLQPVERHVEFLREGAQLALRQVSMNPLDGTKLIENGRMRGGPIHAGVL